MAGGEDSGFADICVYGNDGNTLFMVECKTAGKEYDKEYRNIEIDGGQLFTYWQQDDSCKYLVLYASDLKNGSVVYSTESIDCLDDPNILTLAEKDDSIHIYKNSHIVEDLYECWSETYEKRFCGDIIFRDDSVAYNIGVKPLRKRDLADFSENSKIVNKFEEILRHNNISDKENAFNRLIALFICKLVDEIQKDENDEVDFQYKTGTDTYESLQDRLQRLHKEGMEKFMREEIFYIPDTYAEDLISQYSGYKRKNMIEELKKTLRILKFFTNNDFAFKDVHNEELFYQNGKIVVEVVQLFEHYRIIGSSDIQMLGDLFEQLLNKGFKQNEGQFFTPIPITRFIWDSLPIEKYIKNEHGIEYPKIIDYACGAGHFLTQGIEAVNAAVKKISKNATEENLWTADKVYGIEKDYRLARVSKISLFMHGAGDTNIIFGDGLENYADKGIIPDSFDILVANPPYSVKAFKSHLKLKSNDFRLLSSITNDGSEIETLFVERISQLIKPNGLAAVILPSSILSNDSSSYVGAREELLQHFHIRAIACFGSKTFGATGTNTVVLFMQKINEPPVRFKLVEDSADAILSGEALSDWEDAEIYEAYLAKTEADRNYYGDMIAELKPYTYFIDDEYLKNYIPMFENLVEVKNKQKTKSFQRMSVEEQTSWMNRQFYSFVKAHEKEKIMYFAMVYKQTVLIVTAPSDNAKQKEFLGYDWSNRKGNEGIVIGTPGGMLYNNEDRFANDTLAGLIRDSFDEKEKSLSNYEEYYRYTSLKDMIDFSRVVFNKEIKTTVAKKFEIISKYPIVTLANFPTDIRKGTAITQREINPGNYKVVAGGISFAYTGDRYNRAENIITISASGANAGYVNIWKEKIFASDCTTVQGQNTTETIYIYNFLVAHQNALFALRKGSAQPHVYPDDIKKFPIPLPPPKVQQKIVDECSKIDEEYNTTRMTIEEYRAKIEKLFADLDIIGGGR